MAFSILVAMTRWTPSIKSQGILLKTFIDIPTIGIPKTIDNDLEGTDHTPGFGSAARYIATAVRELAEMLKSTANRVSPSLKQWVVMQAGVLHLLLLTKNEQAPDIILLPGAVL